MSYLSNEGSDERFRTCNLALHLKVQQSHPHHFNPPSDLKPPTIESLVIPPCSSDHARSYYSGRPDNTSVIQLKRKSNTLGELEQNGKFGEDQDKEQLLKNRTTRSQKRIVGYLQEESEIRNQNYSIYLPQKTERFIQRFVNNLISSAYILRQLHLNQFQTKFLTESYVPFLFENGKLSRLFDPFDKLAIIQQLIQLCLTVLLYLWLPYFIAFTQLEDDMFGIYILASIVIVLFVFNCFCNLNRGYVNQGAVVTSRSIIRKNYIQNQFKHQMTSLCCIISLFVLEFVQDDITEIPSFILLFGFIYFSRYEIYRLLYLLQDFLSIQTKLSDLYRLLFVILLIAHYSACIWYYIGIQSQNSWINQLQIQDNDNLSKYCFSLYWAVQTIGNVGYGDIPAKTNVELIYSIVLQFIGCSLFAYSINVVSIILNDINTDESKLNETHQQITNYMVKHSVPFEVKAKVRNYLNYYSQQEIQSNESREIIERLSNDLKSELFHSIRSKALKQCEALSKFSESTLREATFIMESQRFNPGEQILEQHKQDDSSLFLIQQGQVNVYHTEEKILATLEAGQSFGEWGFFTGQMRTAKVKAVGFVQLFKLTQSQFKTILQQNPTDKERFIYIQHSMLFYNDMRMAKLACYSCNSPYHLVMKCPILNYLPNLEKLIKSDNFYDKQYRQDFTRYNNRGVNRAFLRIQTNLEAMRSFRVKYDLMSSEETESAYEDDSSEFTEDDATSLRSPGAVSMKLAENKGEGTMMSLLKMDTQSQNLMRQQSRILQEIDDYNEELFIIRPTVGKGTISTAQFQQQQQDNTQQQNFKIKVSSQRLPEIKQGSSIMGLDSFTNVQSSQQIAQEGPQPIVKKMTKQSTGHEQDSSISGKSLNISNKHQIPQTSFINVEKTRKRNLARIKEEDSDTLNLSSQHRKSSEDFNFAQESQNQLQAMQGIGTRQTQSQSPMRGNTNRQSMKRQSSKLSTIPIRQGTQTQFRSTFGPQSQTQSRSTFKMLTMNMVDLSMYKKGERTSEEFDKMYAYRKYFPLNNFQFVIDKYNAFIALMVKELKASKYTFYFYAKKKASRLRKLCERNSLSQPFKS